MSNATLSVAPAPKNVAPAIEIETEIETEVSDETPTEGKRIRHEFPDSWSNGPYESEEKLLQSKPVTTQGLCVGKISKDDESMEIFQFHAFRINGKKGNPQYFWARNLEHASRLYLETLYGKDFGKNIFAGTKGPGGSVDGITAFAKELGYLPIAKRSKDGTEYTIPPSLQLDKELAAMFVALRGFKEKYASEKSPMVAQTFTNILEMYKTRTIVLNEGSPDEKNVPVWPAFVKVLGEKLT